MINNNKILVLLGILIGGVTLLYLLCNNKSNKSIQKDHRVYEFTDKNNKIDYIGITNNPSRREREHRLDGKKFDRMIVSPLRTKERARNDEKRLLEEYYEKYGELPKYNKKI